jgi:hypothetical protein
VLHPAPPTGGRQVPGGRTISTTTSTPTAAASGDAVAAVRAAVDLAEQRRAGVEDAADALAALEARLSDGDESVSTAALLEARANHDRATLLHKAAETAVATARKALADADTRLVTVVAEAIGGALNAPVTVLPASTTPSWPESPQEWADVVAPAVYLTQRGATTVDPATGWIGGRIELRYARTKFHHRFDRRHLRDMLTAAGVGLAEHVAFSRTVTEVDGGVEVDTYMLTVDRAAPLLPYLANAPEDYDARSLAAAFAADVSECFAVPVDPENPYSTTAGYRGEYGDTSAPVRPMSVRATAAALEHHTAGVRRTTTLRLALSAKQVTGWGRPLRTTLDNAISETCRSFIGSAVRHFGRCTGAEPTESGAVLAFASATTDLAISDTFEPVEPESKAGKSRKSSTKAASASRSVDVRELDDSQRAQLGHPGVSR